MGAVCLCLTAALLFQHAYALCNNQHLNATTTSQLFSYQSYSNNEYCRIQIAPSNNLNSSEFFLEIKWIRFDIKGQMPDCREDFVEVHLTRSEQNIGKFCSSNMKVSPFTMYSHDGFAELIFSSDKKDTGNGFSLSYRLQRKDTQALRKPEGCIFRQESSSLYYTDKWPRGQSDTIFCFRLIKLPEDQNLRISIMDLDLSDASSSGSSHCTAVMQYIQIRESDEEYTAYSTIESYASSISNILCKRQSNNIYIGKKKFVYILEKSNAHSANRGFLIGYTFYTAEGYKDSSFEYIPMVIWICIITVWSVSCTICIIKRRRDRRRIPAPLIMATVPQNTVVARIEPHTIYPGRQDQPMETFDGLINPTSVHGGNAKPGFSQTPDNLDQNLQVALPVINGASTLDPPPAYSECQM